LAPDRSQAIGTYRLCCEVGGNKDQVVLLDKQQVIFGRDEQSCQFVLSQPFISRRHAAFHTDESGRTTVKDLGSASGTFVNGVKITERLLNNGDQVGFGPGGVLTFRFFSVPQVAAAMETDAEAVRSQFIANTQHSGAAVASAQAVKRQPASAASFADTRTIRVGRAPDNDYVLGGAGVSRHHAELRYSDAGGAVITDVGSTNGTYVNGELVTQPRPLKAHDLVTIGGFLLRVDGLHIHEMDLSSSRIYAEHVTKQIQDKIIINDITLALLPREFVGLMGPSGCGKSTLMDALNGLRPASSGTVFLNNLELYRHFNSIRRSIGYVPQRDILHEVLTVERTLIYAAKLRLPEGTANGELNRVVSEVIETVGLTEQRQTQFRQLSGGQQKRLSLAIELLTKPSFLFLDEPTSPLDPETTESMMDLFRKLADQGRIVVMVTHKFEKFFSMNHVAILSRGGHLAFFGPPKAALEYFGCTQPTDIYRRIGGIDPDELSRRFQASPQYANYVSRRVVETRKMAEGHLVGAVQCEATRDLHRKPSLNQWWTLTQRCLETKLKDRRNTALLLLQAPVIALILGFIAPGKNDAKTLFIAAVVAVWFGANNAIRDIVAEEPIYIRERRFSLKIPSYVLSKFAILSAIGLVQALLFVGILVAMDQLSSATFLQVLTIIYLTTLVGISTALLFSALVSTTEKAMSILPLILIPQLLLSGFMIPLQDIYVNMAAQQPTTVEAYDKYQEYDRRMKSHAGTRALGKLLPVDPVQKIKGLNAASPLSTIIMARWSLDGLVQVASLDANQSVDKDQGKPRDMLATRFSVDCYSKAVRGESSSAVESCYVTSVWEDVAALAGFTVLFLGLAMWILKRKDII